MLMQELLKTDVGLMSLIVVLVTISIGGFMFFKLRSLMREEQAKGGADRAARRE